MSEQMAYDSWGKRRAEATPNTSDSIDGVIDNKGFTGHEMLDRLDLVHMNGRVYDPLVARFMSADPIIQAPEHSQSYNRYTYVWNNPTNLTDPTGFVGQPVSSIATQNCAQSVGCQANRTDTPAATSSPPSPKSSGKDDSGGTGAAAPKSSVNSGVVNLTAGDVRQSWAAGAGNAVANAAVGVANLLISFGDISGDAELIGPVQPFTPKSNYFGRQGGDTADGLLLVTGATGVGAGIAGRLEGASAVRLPQDINVNPTAPAALPTSRPIGLSATQNAEAQRIVAEMRSAGYTDIRVNQQQTNALGSRVGVNRPDISGTSPAGQRVHYELDTASSTRGAGHETRIKANDPAAKVILKTVN